MVEYFIVDQFDCMCGNAWQAVAAQALLVVTFRFLCRLQDCWIQATGIRRNCRLVACQEQKINPFHKPSINPKFKLTPAILFVFSCRPSQNKFQIVFPNMWANKFPKFIHITALLLYFPICILTSHRNQFYIYCIRLVQVPVRTAGVTCSQFYYKCLINFNIDFSFCRCKIV
jgi:hypothetical protein